MKSGRAAIRRAACSLAAAASLALSGCGLPQAFDLYPETGETAAGPWPTLIDAVRRNEAAGAPLDPATGASVVAAMDVEAALASAESARLAPPVVDVAPLRRAAREARAGR